MALPPASKETTVLITGASSGIGAELARDLAARGHGVTLVARRTDRLEELARELEGAYGTITAVIPCDLADPGARAALMDGLLAEGPALAGLCNNAGFGVNGSLGENDPDRERQMVELNVDALHDLTVRGLPGMLERGSGAILNVASTAAFQPTPYFAVYGAAKAFVLNFSEALAMELEDHGVSVCCLAPGPTDTAFFDTLDPRRVSGGHFFGKAGRADPREVAAAGVALMLGGGLTRVVGLRNRLMILGNRFVPRSMVATVSKRMLRPLDVAKDAK